MTDRELLELAAKAAGLKHVDYSGIDYDGRLGIVLVDEIGRHCADWDPIRDDGDALRLAVALRINIWLEKTLTIVEVCSDSEAPNLIKKEYCDAETQMAATRRAIVRAAAEIGKGME